MRKITIAIIIILLVAYCAALFVPVQAQSGTWTTPDSAYSQYAQYAAANAIDDDENTRWLSWERSSNIDFDLPAGALSGGARVLCGDIYGLRVQAIYVYYDEYEIVMDTAVSCPTNGTTTWKYFYWDVRASTKIRVQMRHNISSRGAHMHEFDALLFLPTPTPTNTPTATSTPTTTPTPTPTAPPYWESCDTIAHALETLAADTTPCVTETPTPTPDCADYSASLDYIAANERVYGTFTNTSALTVYIDRIAVDWWLWKTVDVIEYDNSLCLDRIQFAGSGNVWGVADGVPPCDTWPETDTAYDSPAAWVGPVIAAPATAYQFVIDFDGGWITHTTAAVSEISARFNLANGCDIYTAPGAGTAPDCPPGGECGDNDLCCMHARDAAFLAACLRVYENEAKCYELMQMLGAPDW